MLGQGLLSTELHPDLISAYQRACYRIAERFDVRIDDYSPDLDCWQQQQSVETSALITAYNPKSQRGSHADNRVATRQLEQWIVETRWPYCPAINLDPQDQWPPEPGFLIGGLDQSQAESLARTFGQNALVWTRSDAVPRLLLLR